MLHELDDTASLWLQDPVTNWREWPAAAAASTAKRVEVAADAHGLVTKVNEDKLARDVDDLSAIFEELADGVVDFPLPCDDDDDDNNDAFAALTTTTEAADAAATLEAPATSDHDLATTTVGHWLDGLDSDDALNVDAIADAFDALVAEQELAMADDSAVTIATDDDDDAMDDDSEYETDDDDDAVGVSMQIVPTAPAWATMAPLDPRSVIKTSVFANVDARIPRIAIPRIDLAFATPSSKPTDNDATGSNAAMRPVGPFDMCVSPVRPLDKATAAEAAAAANVYRHDAATCWICHSDKTPEKKRALHRFLEKRSRRNWKKGPRYSGRSNVAASRVRNGGRFICTTQWI